MATNQRQAWYLVGVDGGGSGTRLQLASADGTVLACASAGPSALMLGSDVAWRATGDATARAFAQLGEPMDWTRCVLGCGLAGINQPEWRAAFSDAAPPLLGLAVESDAYTTLLGAHRGAPGALSLRWARAALAWCSMHGASLE